MGVVFWLLVLTTSGASVRLDDAKVPLQERVKAAKALGKSKPRDVRAIEGLLRGLDGPGEEMKQASVESLKALDAVAVLLPRMLDEKAPLNERREAVKAMRFLKDAAAYPALGQLLGSKHDELRREAAFALTVGGAEANEPALVVALGDAQKDVRYFAAVALGGLKTTGAVKAVEERAKVETEFTVKDALQQAMAKQKR